MVGILHNMLCANEEEHILQESFSNAFCLNEVYQMVFSLESDLSVVKLRR